MKATCVRQYGAVRCEAQYLLGLLSDWTMYRNAISLFLCAQYLIKTIFQMGMEKDLRQTLPLMTKHIKNS